MGKQSPTFSDFNPTGDDRVNWIKGNTDAVIKYVRDVSSAFGPEGKRRASLAITHYENASMWAVKALFSEDAIAGDDGGAKERIEAADTHEAEGPGDANP